MEKAVCPVCKREFTINENDRKSYAINDERVCSVDCFLKAVLTPQDKPIAAYVPAKDVNVTETVEKAKEPFEVPEIIIVENKDSEVENATPVDNTENIKDAEIVGAQGPQGDAVIVEETKTVKKTTTSGTTRKTTSGSAKKTTSTKNKTTTAINN